MLDEARVAITPGEAFDSPGFFRLSYATSMTDLQRGTAKILEFMRALESRGAPARA
jgi:aspartate/methionine/tyrosine aminotransferase